MDNDFATGYALGSDRPRWDRKNLCNPIRGHILFCTKCLKYLVKHIQTQSSQIMQSYEHEKHEIKRLYNMRYMRYNLSVTKRIRQNSPFNLSFYCNFYDLILSDER